MSFHVRITLTNVHKEASRSIIAIGDTIFIDQAGKSQVVTASIPKKYSVISYSLEDEEEEKPKKPAAQPKSQPAKKKKVESSEDYGDESEGDSENSAEVID